MTKIIGKQLEVIWPKACLNDFLLAFSFTCHIRTFCLFYITCDITSLQKRGLFCRNWGHSYPRIKGNK